MSKFTSIANRSLPVRRGISALLLVGATSLLAAPGAHPAEEALLCDDFEKEGPLDPAKWKLVHGEPPLPDCYGGLLVNSPQKMWSSQRAFSEPVSVEFSGVYLGQIPQSNDNHLGLALGGYGRDMVSWCFWGPQETKLLVPCRRVAGEYLWRASTAKAIALSQLPDITKRENGINLRIDWWPGVKVVYYLNSRFVAEFNEQVPNVAVPVGVRDESVYVRIDSVRVTALEKNPKAADTKARIEDIARQFPRKLRMVIATGGYMWGIDEQLKAELEAAGMEVRSYPDVPMIAGEAQPPRIWHWDQLKTHNLLVFSDQFYHLLQPDPVTGEMPEDVQRLKPLLYRFLEEGGGLFFGGTGEYDFGKGVLVLNYLLKELNARAFAEVVRDPATMVTLSGPSLVFRHFCFTDAVASDPLTEGVKGLWYPFGHEAGCTLPNLPIEVGPEWRVLVRALPTAASYPVDLKADDKGSKLSDTPGAFKSSPTLIAVREYGKGRVVLWPMWTEFGVFAGSHPGTGQMAFDGEREGHKSNGLHLVENLLCWLAEPSQQSKTLGLFDPKAVKAPAVARLDPDRDARNFVMGRKGGNEYKGLIGAHSNLSDGQSSPEEMIAAARNSGYDFVAFTEDLATMNQEKWNQLRAVCDKASREHPNFAAYPGLDFLDDAGNRGLVFGQQWWPQKEAFGEKHPGRIKWWYCLAYQANSDPWKWPPRIIVHSKTNNKRPWNQGLWNFFAPYCYEGGKLVDNSFAEWRPMIGRYAFHMNAAICAVHTVRNVDDIPASLRPGRYQTYVRGNGLQDVLSKMSGIVDFFAYISTGPRIENFEVYYVGDWEGAHMDVPGNQVLRLHLRVKAEAGLRELQVYDGDRLARRLKPKGKDFETRLTFPLDDRHCYSMTVIDNKGGQAVSWNAYVQILERVHRRCGDNYNWMRTGKARAGSLPGPMMHETLPLGVAEPPAYSLHSAFASHGGLSPACDGYLKPAHMKLEVEGNPYNANWPAVTMDFAAVGRYGEIITNRVRYDYDVIAPVGFTVGAFSGPYSVMETPWPAELRQHVPEPRFNGMTVSRYSGDVRFTKAAVRPDGGPIRFDLGGNPQWANNPAGKEGLVLHLVRPDGTSQRFLMSELKDDSSYDGTIPAGGYLALCGPDAQGSGAIVALSPGVRYSFYKRGDYSWLGVFTELPGRVAPGTRANWDVLLAAHPRGPGNTIAPTEDLRLGMGIAGKPTLYEVKPRMGEVADQKFALRLRARDHGFSGTIGGTTEKLLPIHLPVFVEGLNRRWDAGLWYKGKTHLEVVRKYRDPWGVESPYHTKACYEPRVDEIQRIPVLEGGTGYCQVDTDKQDADLFVGNFLVCDESEVFISLVKAEKGKCAFEINNPTDNLTTCMVRPSRGFELTGRWLRRLRLAPGSVETVTVRSGVG